MKIWCMGPYAGVDYNLTLSRLQSQLQHIYHGQPYASVDFNPILETTLSPSQGLWIWPLHSFLHMAWKENNLSVLTTLFEKIG